MKISRELQKHYDKQYSDNIEGWRKISAIYKVNRITSLLGDRKSLKVLEWGAGEGSIVELLDLEDSINEIHALEISASGIKHIKSKKLKKLKSAQQFDGYKTKYTDDQFDIAICSHVIEHVEYPRALIREIKRISKQQIFEVPLDYSFRVSTQVEHYLSYGHINIYSPAIFKFLLKSEGLKIQNELFDGISLDIRRYQKYKNLGVKKSIFTELLIISRELILKIIGFFIGKRFRNEYLSESYTCITN